MRQQGLAKILDGKVPSSREECFMSHLYYFNVFGSIMYALECIRLDILTVVSVVNPSKVYWQAMNLIFRYLQSAIDIGLVFDKDSDIDSSVIGYVDSDNVGDLVVTRGDFILEQIVFEENPMDMLTKPVLIFKFKSYLNLIIVYSL
jgi:hypothetical protein